MIQQKVIDYIDRCLSSSGFAVLHAATAFRLDPRRWPTLIGCGFDFSSIHSPAFPALVQDRGCAIYIVKIKDIEQPVRVLARTDRALEERLLHVAGLRASHVRPWTPEAAAPAEAPKPAAPKDDEPPAYPCLARTRWYEARGLRDPLLDRPAEQRLATVDEGVFAGKRVTKPRF